MLQTQKREPKSLRWRDHASTSSIAPGDKRLRAANSALEAAIAPVIAALKPEPLGKLEEIERAVAEGKIVRPTLVSR